MHHRTAAPRRGRRRLRLRQHDERVGASVRQAHARARPRARSDGRDAHRRRPGDELALAADAAGGGCRSALRRRRAPGRLRLARAALPVAAKPVEGRRPSVRGCRLHTATGSPANAPITQSCMTAIVSCSASRRARARRRFAWRTRADDHRRRARAPADARQAQGAGSRASCACSPSCVAKHRRCAEAPPPRATRSTRRSSIATTGPDGAARAASVVAGDRRAQSVQD